MDKPAEDLDSRFQIAFYENVLERVPDYIQVIELLGCLYTEEGRIDDGLRMDKLAVEIQPKNSTAHYNLACSLCLKTRDEEALRTLSKAIDLGYSDIDWLLQDDDLLALHEHPQFQALVNRLKASLSS